MHELQHPVTGEHLLVRDPETAAEYLEEGWQEIVAGGESEQDAEAAPEHDGPNGDPNGDPNGGGETPPSPEKPLDKMKMPELIEYAEKIGVPADELDPYRKPGKSKAQAIELINAHIAAQQS